MRHPSTKAFFTVLLLLSAAIPSQAASATRAFSVLWGGDSWDFGLAIEPDASGDVRVVGTTVSSDFPSTSGSAPSEIFIARLSAAGQLLSATAFGGAGDSVHAVARDASGNLYLAGSARSPDFPATTSLGPPGAQQRVFVAKLDPAGQLVYATAFGGTRRQGITGIAVDSGGQATVTGVTDSP